MSSWLFSETQTARGTIVWTIDFWMLVFYYLWYFLRVKAFISVALEPHIHTIIRDCNNAVQVHAEPRTELLRKCTHLQAPPWTVRSGDLDNFRKCCTVLIFTHFYTIQTQFSGRTGPKFCENTTANNQSRSTPVSKPQTDLGPYTVLSTIHNC